jgi:hypothetical protein
MTENNPQPEPEHNEEILERSLTQPDNGRRDRGCTHSGGDANHLLNKPRAPPLPPQQPAKKD